MECWSDEGDGRDERCWVRMKEDFATKIPPVMN